MNDSDKDYFKGVPNVPTKIDQKKLPQNQAQQQKIEARRAEIEAGRERSKQAQKAMQAIVDKEKAQEAKKLTTPQTQVAKKAVSTSLMMTILRIATEEIAKQLPKIVKGIKEEIDRQLPTITKALEQDIKRCRACINVATSALKWLSEKTLSAVLSLSEKAEPTAKESLKDALESTDLRTGATINPDDKNTPRKTKAIEPEEPEHQSSHKPQ